MNKIGKIISACLSAAMLVPYGTAFAAKADTTSEANTTVTGEQIVISVSSADEIRTLKNQFSKLPSDVTDIVVEIAGGEYELREGIKLDGLTLKDRKLTIKAKDGEEPILKGSKSIDVSRFQAITDKSILMSLPQQAAQYVGVIDLAEQGFERDEIDFISGWEPGGVCYPVGVYFNDSRETLARFPNSSYLRIDNVLNIGGERRWNRNRDVHGVMEVTQSNIKRWGNAKNAFLEGALAAEYFFEWAKIGSIDTEAQTITCADWTQYGLKNNLKWSIINLIEELDNPGEWYIDFDKMLMYYYPRYPINAKTDEMEIAVLKDTMIKIENAKNVTIDGLTLCNSAGDGIDIFSSSDVTVKNCKLYNLAGKGVWLQNATDDRITCNDIYEIGQHGIHMQSGGNRNTLTPNGVMIDNNHIFRTGTDSGDNWCGAVFVDHNTVGTVVQNNILHGIKNYTYCFGGNDNLFLYNEVFNGNRETADSTPVYSGRQLSESGNTMKYNYLHDCVNDGHSDYTNWGITTGDDWESGVIIESNIVYMGNPNKGLASGTHSRDNSIRYNILMCSKYGLECRDRFGKSSGPLINRLGTGDAVETLIMSLKGGNGLDAGFHKTKVWLEKYPQMNEMYEDYFENNGEWTVSGNLITDNVSVEAENYITDKVYEQSTVERNLELGKDYSIFVDPENQDYRLTMDAVRKYDLSDKIPNEENFSMDEIGIQTDMREIEKPSGEFRKTYPQNGASNIQRENLQLSWERAEFADEYHYVVATDPELKNIVASGKCFENSVMIEGLENNRTYYWDVDAKNISRQIGNEWESVGDPYCFKTAEYDIVDKTFLNNEIQSTEELYNSITEGTKVGDFRVGTKSAILEVLNRAKAVSQAQNCLTEEVAGARADLMILQQRIEGYKVKGYTTVDTSDTSKWHTMKEGCTVTADDNGITLTGTGQTLSYKDIIQNYQMLKFKVNANFDGGWLGLALRQRNPDETSYYMYGQSYLIVIKPEIFELQKYNLENGVPTGIIRTYPNNGIFESNKDHEVMFGAVSVDGGVEIRLDVDGNNVIDYLDTEQEVFNPGYFVMTQTSNQKINVKSVDVTDEIYEPDSSLFETAATDSVYYTTDDDCFVETGAFEDSTEKGYDDGKVRVTKDGVAKWDVKEIKQARYKFYYWHTPLADGDKHATVRYETIGGTGLSEVFEKKVDFSSGEAGWREIGTFYPSSADTMIASFNVQIKGSGNGKVPASAIRLDAATDAELEFSSFFHKVNKDLVIMKVGANEFYNNIEKQSLDVAPEIQSGRTLVPVRAIAESFGFDVSFDSENSIVGLKNDKYDIVMPIGSTEFIVNGETKVTDLAPVIKDGRTLLPLRALAEAIGKEIYWDATNELVLIGTTVVVNMHTSSYNAMLASISDSLKK